MHQNYLDAMAMVRKYGKPTFFVTFTTNPSWDEIRENLEPGQHATDRPELTARVFNLKMKELLADLIHRNVLGKLVAYTWVIEFQKRGLPHMHFLGILASTDKPRTPDDVDKLVSAEFPDFNHPEHGELREIILGSQVHGPCKGLVTTAPCLVDNECTKGYPKDFKNNTELRESAYPLYRRRDQGTPAIKGEHPMDSRDVVPYNPRLSKKYKAHIIIEIVASASIRAVKYLYKYTYKGYDRAEVVAIP